MILLDTCDMYGHQKVFPGMIRMLTIQQYSSMLLFLMCLVVSEPRCKGLIGKARYDHQKISASGS